MSRVVRSRSNPNYFKKQTSRKKKVESLQDILLDYVPINSLNYNQLVRKIQREYRKNNELCEAVLMFPHLFVKRILIRCILKACKISDEVMDSFAIFLDVIDEDLTKRKQIEKIENKLKRTVRKDIEDLVFDLDDYFLTEIEDS